MHATVLDMKSTDINAIKPQYRQYGGKTARGAARGVFEDLRQAECVGEYGAGFFVPIVKITGDHQRSMVRHHFSDAIVQRLELRMSAPLE